MPNYQIRINKALQLFSGIGWRRFEVGTLLDLHAGGRVTLVPPPPPRPGTLSTNSLTVDDTAYFYPYMTANGTDSGRLAEWVRDGVVSVLKVEEIDELPVL